MLIALAAAPATLAEAAGLPCTNGMAGSYPCRNVDLMSFIPHTTWGPVDSQIVGNDVWGWVDPVTGHEWALVGTYRGTAFVDVTDPEAPLYAGFLAAPGEALSNPLHCEHRPTSGAPSECANASWWRDLEVYADHAFIVSEDGHGLFVFDLRQLRDVTGPPVQFAPTAHYQGFGNAHTISINTQTGFAYVNGSRTANACLPGATDTGGPVIIDVRIPQVPAFAGCDLTDGYTHDSQCVTYAGADSAHAGKEICLNSNEDTLTINDVTDKASVARIARVAYDGVHYTHQGWLTPDHRYFVLDDEKDEGMLNHNTRTYIFDLLDLDAPIVIGAFTNTTRAIDHNQFVFGSYVYQSNYTAGLRILETAPIASGTLSEVAFFDILPSNDEPAFQGTWSNYPFFESGTVVVNTMEPSGGLFVLRPTLADLRLSSVRLPPASTEVEPVRFSVANAGPSSASNARFSLSGAATPSSIVSSQGTCDLPSKSCALGTLLKGQVVSVDVVFHRRRPARFRASALADEVDTRPRDNVVRGHRAAP